ncbi:hypothetical protein FRC01_009344 [Tulasnella sp. 417]|nr:hypothetical protein FRC01_009344 [Tulasnella sp. 417]
MPTTETTVIATELGLPIPYLPHAISVSFPTWQDSLDNWEGVARVVEAVTTGYPRFFIHRSIQFLARICEEKFGSPGERCLLVSSAKLADAYRSYLLVHSSTPIAVRVAQHPLSPTTPDPKDPTVNQNDDQTPEDRRSCPRQPLELHMVFFPEESLGLARSYWQSTGHGISSRRACKYLELLGIPPSDVLNVAGGFSSSSTSSAGTPNNSSPGSSVKSLQDGVRQTQTMQLVKCDEQPLPYTEARLALQRRIARAVRGDFSGPSEPPSPIPENGVRTPSNDDVFLHPGGMNAIWHAHQLILQTAEQMGNAAGKSICFGFPYSKTLKVLENWGPGCHFFGGGVDDELSEVRRVAQEAVESGSPIVALFCEVATNPLLRSPNLAELRRIADEFDFLIVVDDSIGNFVNVILVLNPQRRHYAVLRDRLKSTYEDLYWHEDVVCMDLNSRNFAHRIDVINRNSEAVAEWLWHQSEAYNNAQGDAQNSEGKKRVITNVFYPKWVMRENYDACRRRAGSAGNPRYPSGFGGLFTILFCDEPAARAFYDNLGCEKGPTWGSNFTLACPYTILAHYCELDWAAKYGVPINVVRISVGMEEEETILGWVKYALAAAEKATQASS